MNLNKQNSSFSGTLSHDFSCISADLASSIGWCKKKSETFFGLLQTGSCRDRPGTVNTLKYAFFGSTILFFLLVN